MTCLIDTNVIIDVLTKDREWSQWSTGEMRSAAEREPIVVNDIIYAELCGRYEAAAELELALDGLSLQLVSLNRPALFRAGQAHRRYRRRGGPRECLLPDFLIGAHAAVEGWTLLSRDPRRYRTDFPELRVICP